jgi:RNA polymerase sigma factor (sigma-70 family)
MNARATEAEAVKYLPVEEGDPLISLVQRLGISVEELSTVRERAARLVVKHYREFLDAILLVPELESFIIAEMDRLNLPGERQGVAREVAIRALLIEHKRSVCLGLFRHHTAVINADNARRIFDALGRREDLPPVYDGRLSLKRLQSFFDKLTFYIKRDYERYKRAQSQLFYSHLRQVYDIARRHQSDRVAFHDLLQEGCIGLLHAIDKSDNLDNRLSTSAHSWTTKFVLSCLEGNRFPVHVPINIVRKMRKLEDEMVELRGLMQSPLPLDEPTGEDDLVLAETVADPSAANPALAAVRQEVSLILQMLLALLTPTQRRVLVLRYGLDGRAEGCTLQEVAALTGVTWGQVHRCEQRALARIRRGPGLLIAREMAACLG